MKKENILHFTCYTKTLSIVAVSLLYLLHLLEPLNHSNKLSSIATRQEPKGCNWQIQLCAITAISL